MNITRKDLEPEILEKIDRLDNVVNNYGSGATDGFLSYNPEQGFYFKKTNDTFLRKVYDENEIIALKEGLENPVTNVFSTNNGGINLLDDSFNAATEKLIHTIKPVLNIPNISKSAIRKYVNNRYYCYIKVSGEFVVADMNKNFNIIYHTNVIEKIQVNFNLSKDMRVFNVADFVFEDNKNVIIATDRFGTYKYNLENDEVELLFSPESRVRCIEITHTNKLFVACDEYCAIYDFDGNLIEKYYNVAEAHQIPDKIFKTSTDIFVLGKATGINQLDSLLHGWTLDEAEVGYNCIDNVIMPNPSGNEFSIFKTQLTDDYLFLYVKNYNYIDVWKYDLDSLELDNFRLLDNAQEINDVLFVNNAFIISQKYNELVIISNKTIKYKTNKALYDLISLPDGILGMDVYRMSAEKYEIKDFTRHIEDLCFKCSLPEKSNNIDILIAGGADLKVKLYTVENRNVQPAFAVKYGKDLVYKLMNYSEQELIIEIHVDENTVLDGIVIKSNRMFLR